MSQNNLHTSIAVSGIVITVFFIVIVSWKAYQENSLRSIDVPIFVVQHDVITIEELAKDFSSYFIIDVREREEYSQGRFIGAHHVPLGELLTREAVRQQLRETAGERTIVFFCHDGLRSMIAADLFSNEGRASTLMEKGFRQIRRFDGDLAGIWEGSRTYSLPYDFHNDLAQREYVLSAAREDTLIVDMTWDQTGTDSNALPGNLMRMTDMAVDALISEIGENTFTALCNSRMSCFYAKVLGYRVENNGGVFLGYVLIDDK